MYLSRLLQQAGHEVLVLGLEGTLSARKGEEWGLPMRYLPLNTTTPWGIASLYCKLKELVHEFKPDVVNCHRGESFILWGLLKQQTRAFRLVRTRGDQRLPKANPINKWLHNAICDAVITTNSRMSRHFLNAFHLAPDKLHQILGGVDTQHFLPDLAARKRIRDEYGYLPEHFVIGLLGRFDEVKGQRELIQSIAQLRSQGMSHLRLLLLGFDSATPESTVQTWLTKEGIADITIITGKRPDIAQCLNALDLGVVASLWSETIARAALEIMATAVPLISTNVGVMPDLLEPAALFAPGDTAAMAERIRSVHDDPTLRSGLRQTQSERMCNLGGQNFLSNTLTAYQNL